MLFQLRQKKKNPIPEKCLPSTKNSNLTFNRVHKLKKKTFVRNKTAILSNPVTMTSFLLMARIFVFETAEILASTIYLCINTENLNQSIEWSIPQFIYLSTKVTVSTKIKIEKKLVRLNVIHVSVAKHGCFFFFIILLNQNRSPLLGAFNSHTGPMSQRFHRTV